MDGLRILTISGWTQPADALHTLAPAADVLDYAELAYPDAVAEATAGERYDLVIGWSLGGIIARHLLARGAIEAPALVSISSPYQFVRNAQVEAAMPPETFAQFYSNYRDDTARTVERFHGLVAKGDAHHKRILQELAHHPQVLQTEKWLRWMDFLERYTAQKQDYSALPPTLIVHGEQDAIVPFPQAKKLQEYLPNARLLSLPDAGHAPHLHDTAALRDAITQFHQEVTQ